MPSLPAEVLLGIYLGLLAGIVPAFAAGALGFVVRYLTGVTLPGFGVVVLALAIASVNGGLLVLAEPEIIGSPRLLVAVLVVIMLALYTHSQGDELGAKLPRRVSLTSLRKRTLSADVVELVGSVGQVTVRPTGEIRDVEGYPPLPAALRTTIREGSWRLPADLPLSELERRLEERLRTEHDLADVSVTIDERARATIAAAPPSGRLSGRVPGRRRAVSIDALVPTGLAAGDDVTVLAGDEAVSGTVLSVRADGDDADRLETADATAAADPPRTDGGTPEDTPTTRSTPGGEGRVTVSVRRGDARTVLGADRGRIVVRSRGTSPEFEALSLLGGADVSVRRVTVSSELEADALAEASAGVTILAAARRREGVEADLERPRGLRARLAAALDGWSRRANAGRDAPPGDGGRRREWVFTPDVDRPLEPGDEAFVAGTDRALERFLEVAA